jgi:hypothetical protein
VGNQLHAGAMRRCTCSEAASFAFYESKVEWHQTAEVAAPALGFSAPWWCCAPLVPHAAPLELEAGELAPMLRLVRGIGDRSPASPWWCSPSADYSLWGATGNDVVSLVVRQGAAALTETRQPPNRGREEGSIGE